MVLLLAILKVGNVAFIYIANIGYGIATNISVKFLSEKPMVFKKHLDNDNSHHLFEIEFEPDYREILPTLTDSEKVVLIEYEDIFGRKIITLNNFTYMAYASAVGLQAKPSDWHLKLPGSK